MALLGRRKGKGKGRGKKEGWSEERRKRERCTEGRRARIPKDEVREGERKGWGEGR